MRLLAALLFAIGLYGQAVPMGSVGPFGGGEAPALHLRSDHFSADGTWTAPSGVTEATVELWAAGGTGTNNTGAGGGGEYCRSTVAVTPSSMYAVVVGDNGDGENSSFATTTVTAVGGNSGAEGSAGGTGGTGDTCFAGGAGDVGTGERGGGGGGGTEEAGGAGSSQFFGSNLYAAGGRSQSGASLSGEDGHARITYEVAVTAGLPLVTGRSFGRNGANSTSHVINLPACPSGRLLIVLFSVDGAPALTHTGWTSIADTADGTNNVKGAAIYKTSTGSDTLTITTGSTQGSSHFSYCIFGATGNPDATTTSGSSANGDPPSHTHGGGSTDALWIAFLAEDGALGAGGEITAQPAGYDSFLHMSSEFNEGSASAVAMLHATAATEDPAAFTAGNDQWVAITVAIPGS